MQDEKLIAEIARIVSGTRRNKQASYDAARAILPIIARERDNAAAAQKERDAAIAEGELMLAHDGYDLTGFHGENTRCRAIAAAIRSADNG